MNDLTDEKRRAQEQGNKTRVRGIDAQKANIAAAKSVARTLRSSLGPKARLFWTFDFFSSRGARARARQSVRRARRLTERV